MRRELPLALTALILLLAAPAARAQEPDLPRDMDRITAAEAAETPGVFDVWDPFEPVNRRIYRFNHRFDAYVFLPAVRTYEFILPGFLRQGITNFLANLGEVPIFVNSVLQLRPRKAGETLARFVLNSTIGIAGLWDHATGMGLPVHHGTFGQTLGRYGAGAGPFIVIPLLGPSSLRDGSGMLVDTVVAFQINLLNVRGTMADYPATIVVEAVDTRANVSFQYGDLGTPFEYELVRFISMARLDLLAEGP